MPYRVEIGSQADAQLAALDSAIGASVERKILWLAEKFDRSIEPFAGSACLYFAIALKKAIIPDLHAELIDAYQTIIRHSIRVLRLAKALGSHSGGYYRVSELEPSSLPPTHRAARFLYLNRHCFNALCRTESVRCLQCSVRQPDGGFPDEMRSAIRQKPSAGHSYRAVTFK